MPDDFIASSLEYQPATCRFVTTLESPSRFAVERQMSIMRVQDAAWRFSDLFQDAQGTWTARGWKEDT